MKKLIILAALLLPFSAQAQLAYDSMTDDENGGPCFGAERFAATGFMTASDPYSLETITFRLHDVSDASETPFTMSLYDDNGGEPGSLIQALGAGLGTWDGDATYPIYTFNLFSAVALDPNTTYWVVAAAEGGDDTCKFGWSRGSNNSNTGNFSHVGIRQGNSGDGWGSSDGDLTQMAIGPWSGLGTSLPVPVDHPAALLALVLLMMSVGLLAVRRTG